MLQPQQAAVLAAHWDRRCTQHPSLTVRDSLQMVHTDDFCSLAQLSGSSMNTTAINAFASTSSQYYLHSRTMCPFVQYVMNFLKIATLKRNAWVYFQNIENTNPNTTSQV